MVPVIIIVSELIIRAKPPQLSRYFDIWSVFDKVRLGATYAVILEAFKLGS